MICRECGAEWREHRFLGEFVMHPGFADTWDEHVKVADSLSREEKVVALRKRRRRLWQDGVIDEVALT